MKDDRNALYFLGLALLAGVGGLAYLFSSMGGAGKWTLAQRAEEKSGVSRPVVPKGGGRVLEKAAEPEIDPEAEARAALEAELDAKLEKMLHDRVQDVTAIENQAVLKFKDQAAYEAFLKRAEAAGLHVLRQLRAIRTASVSYDDLKALKNDMLKHPKDYENVGSNYLAKIPGVPDPETRPDATAGVPFSNSLMAFLELNGVDRSVWGRGVLVGVVDSGVADHPTFRAGQVSSVDLVNDGTAPAGHGTAMASLIGGSDRTFGGIAPGSDILSIRITDQYGDSSSDMIAEGILTAVQKGAKVVNVSMGSYGDSQAVRDALDIAKQYNVLVVAAAGNETGKQPAYPARYAGTSYWNVISVGAVDATGKQAYFSNSGDTLSISAPGISIPAAWPEDLKTGISAGEGVAMDGTSPATALVSGQAARLIAEGIFPQNVPNMIKSAAVDVGTPGWDRQTGAGVLNPSGNGVRLQPAN